MTHVLVRFLAGMVGQVDVLRLESRGLRLDDRWRRDAR